MAELAASRKTAKYTELESHYLFQPIVVESLGLLNSSAVSFLSGLGQRITEVSGEDREGSFLFQRLSVFGYTTALFTRLQVIPAKTFL